ncbi:hypothetical protein HK102_001136 [Quaeritorhiza haematococci]|nr:hypothetical protein HK102_001136 [Quaeritorhiza haematococci]
MAPAVARHAARIAMIMLLLSLLASLAELDSFWEPTAAAASGVLVCELCGKMGFATGIAAVKFPTAVKAAASGTEVDEGVTSVVVVLVVRSTELEVGEGDGRLLFGKDGESVSLAFTAYTVCLSS